MSYLGFWTLVLVFNWNLFAGEFSQSSRNAHPVGFMHQLPVALTPGWKHKYWINLEASKSNIWNAPIELRNKDTGDIYSYYADYEQNTHTIDGGLQLNEDFSFGAELSLAERNGGNLDHLIDETHQKLGTQRFSRTSYSEGQAIFRVSKNGQSIVDENGGQGLSNLTYRLRYWPLKWTSKDACPCGLGFSGHFKFPIAHPNKAWTSGGVDSSFYMHLGMPIGETGGLWATAGFSYLPVNDVFQGWPREKYIQMYDLSGDFPLGAGFGFYLQGRLESPFFDQDRLEPIQPEGTKQSTQLLRRMASGWNSLVRWRAYESIGLRYLINSNTRATLMINEDYNKGDADEIGDAGYVHNAPDVSFTFQLNIGF